MEKETENKGMYDGSEMDEVSSPPLKMVGVFLLITVIGFCYAFLWELLLTK